MFHLVSMAAPMRNANRVEKCYSLMWYFYSNLSRALAHADILILNLLHKLL